MSPLAGLMLLAFFLLIVLVLLVWALLVPGPTARRDDRRPEQHDEPEPSEGRLVRPSNDDVRGAKAVPKRPVVPDDAFERFLRSGRDDDR